MFTSRSNPLSLLFGVAFALAACDPTDPEARFGVDLSQLEFNLFSDKMGIHPNDDILADPNNPFRDTPISEDRAFDALDFAGPVGVFYMWGTNLAIGPNGERQFYTSNALTGIFNSELYPEGTRETVRTMAIESWQALLDFFPNATNVTREGAFGFRYATEAYNNILELGGEVRGDWVLVTVPTGLGTTAVEAVLASDPIVRPVPAPEPEEDDE